MATQDEDKVKLRWRGEDTVELPHLGVVLAKGDTVEVPASLLNVDGDPAGEGFYFPPEVWSVVSPPEVKRRYDAAEKARTAKAEEAAIPEAVVESTTEEAPTTKKAVK